MVLISDGSVIAVSGTYPVPYSILPKAYLFDSARRQSTALFLIALNVILCCVFIFLLISRSSPSVLTTFSIGFPSIVILLKFFIQKKVKIERKNAKISGVAAKRIWVEHLTSCFALALSGLWANQMQGLQLFDIGLFTLISCFSIAAACWPFANLFICRKLL